MKEAAIQIRKCTLSDLEALIQISRNTFIEAFEKDNDPQDFKAYITTAFAKENIVQQLKNPHSTFYFLYTKDKLAGYFKLNEKQGQSEKMPDDAMELERIYVAAPFQDLGLGASMLQEAIELAKIQKKKQLWLGVWQENPNAVRFYERHGFKKFGTHPYFIGKDKQTDWLMRYDLSNFN